MRPTRPLGSWARGGAFQPRHLTSNSERQASPVQIGQQQYKVHRETSWVLVTIGIPDDHVTASISEFTDRLKAEAKSAYKPIQDQPLSVTGASLNEAVQALGNLAELRMVKLGIIVDIDGNLDTAVMRNRFTDEFGKSIFWFTVMRRSLRDEHNIQSQIDFFCKTFLRGHVPVHSRQHQQLTTTRQLTNKEINRNSQFDNAWGAANQSKSRSTAAAWSILTIGAKQYNAHCRRLIYLITEHLKSSSDRLKNAEPYQLFGSDIENVMNQYDQLVSNRTITLTIVIIASDYVKEDHSQSYDLKNMLLRRFGSKTRYFTVEESCLNDDEVEQHLDIFRTSVYKTQTSGMEKVRKLDNNFICHLYTDHIIGNCQLSILPLELMEVINNGSLVTRLGETGSINEDIDTKLLKICAFIASRTDSKTIVGEFLVNLIKTDFLQNFLDLYLSDLPSLSQSSELIAKGDHVNHLLDVIIASLRSIHKTAVEKLRGQMTSLRLMASLPQLKDSDSLWNVNIQEKIRLMDELRLSADGSERQKPMVGHLPISADFRAVPIPPCYAELSSCTPPKLEPNRINGPYDSSEQYLSIQFALLREDMVGPLRDAIEQIRVNALRDPRDNSPQNQKHKVVVYSKVTLNRPIFKRDCLKFVHEATFPTRKTNFLKKLQWGSLVCLSNDNFKDSMILALIEDRTQLLQPNTRGQRSIDLSIIGNEVCADIDYCKEYTMCESSAYYEAYKHILNGLQMFSPGQPIPFERYFVRCETTVERPLYQKMNPSMNLSCLLERNAQHNIYSYGHRYQSIYNLEHNDDTSDDEDSNHQYQTHIVENLSNEKDYLDAETYQLDMSQFAALKLALRSDLCLIQGPPGTGKTYIGYKLVQVLLDNRMKWSPWEKQPILVICYTNHALDQFLEGCIKYCKSSLIRVGTRSKSSELEKYNLSAVRNNLAFGQRVLPDGVFQNWNCHQRALMSLKDDWRLAQSVLCGLEMGSILSVYTLNNYLGRFKEEFDANIDLANWLGLPYDGCTISFMPQQKTLSLLRLGLASDDESAKSAVILSRIWKLDETEYIKEDVNGYAKRSNDRRVQRLLRCWLPCELMMDKTHHVWKMLRNERINVPCAVEGVHMLLQIFSGCVIPVVEILKKAAEDSFRHCVVSTSEFTMKAQTAVDAAAVQLDAETNNERIVDDEFFEAAGILIVNESVDDYVTFDLNEDNLFLRLDESVFPSQLHLLMNIEAMNDDEYMAVDETKIEQMPIEKRWALYRRWALRVEADMGIYLKQIERKQIIKQKELSAARQLCDLHLLKSASLIGMTTTGAAKYQAMLQGLAPPIIVVEEAAEVLESHVITSLHAKCQQLILIGDHKQLRPKVASQLLENKYKLNISLFERLIMNNFPFATLACQHRMRPVICDTLVKRFYPDLVNDESVYEFEDVTGICHNLLFITHSQPEQEEDNRSYYNQHEVDWIEALVKHILRQGYQPAKVTVLCAYLKQMFEVKARMTAQSDAYKQVQYSVVDNYQGEENDFLILSLVRSENKRGTIGFLKNANRVCVALSRAREGLFIVGNLEFLARHSPLWKGIQSSLKEIGAVHDGLSVSCLEPDHIPFTVSNPRQLSILSPDGGCQAKCDEQFDCGHSCPLHCHNVNKDHIDVDCLKPCERLCDADLHACKQLCFEKCDPCVEPVRKSIPICGHKQQMKCSTTPEHNMCITKCTRQMTCLHDCPSLCGFDCANVECGVEIQVTLLCGHTTNMQCHRQQKQAGSIKCQEKVTKTWPVCNHSCETECSIDVFESPCPQPCRQPVPDCEHSCHGTCGQCWQGRMHVRCQEDCNRLQICGHECKHKCASICQPCTAPCETKCAHSKCATAYAVANNKNRHCGQSCPQCQEPCTWACKHHQCTRKCFEVCDRPMCNVACGQKLECSTSENAHYCVGVCNGEHNVSCPYVVIKDDNGHEKSEALCKICHPEEWAVISTVFFGYEDDEFALFIQLEDCGCILEYQAMDQFVKSKVDDPDAAIVNLNCPKCQTAVRCSVRYGAMLKQRQQDVEKIKRKMEQHYDQSDLDEIRKSWTTSLNRRFARRLYYPNTLPDVTDTFRLIGTKLAERLAKIDRKHLNVSTLHMNEIHFTLLDSISQSNALKLTLKLLRDQSPKRVFRIWLEQLPKLMAIWNRHMPRCYVIDTRDSEGDDESQSKSAELNPERLFLRAITQLITWLSKNQTSETMLRQFNEEFQRMEMISQLIDISLKCAKTGCDIDDEHIPAMEQLLTDLCRPVPLTIAKYDVLIEQLNAVTKLIGKNPDQILNERKEIAKAIGFSKGHWYKCGKCGEFYVIADCGRPMTESRCANCKNVIGGTAHQLVTDGARADMEMIGENMY